MPFIHNAYQPFTALDHSLRSSSGSMQPLTGVTDSSSFAEASHNLAGGLNSSGYFDLGEIVNYRQNLNETIFPHMSQWGAVGYPENQGQATDFFAQEYTHDFLPLPLFFANHTTMNEQCFFQPVDQSGVMGNQEGLVFDGVNSWLDDGNVVAKQEPQEVQPTVFFESDAPYELDLQENSEYDLYSPLNNQPVRVKLERETNLPYTFQPRNTSSPLLWTEPIVGPSPQQSNSKYLNHQIQWMESNRVSRLNRAVLYTENEGQGMESKVVSRPNANSRKVVSAVAQKLYDGSVLAKVET